ncbi:hypothetical protein QDR37_14475 [Amnibacterium sp. CER49]|uniref:hypothetical protein n=1 Tax=Amnibacterium sp. CER49 TaxID=3039161 RepID=UPI00244D050B|nr:hypothetical protein [Amnibacterium sp. CER49]MDH2445156.1 hypothetical protein [Amnibacterium sp. CER49]
MPYRPSRLGVALVLAGVLTLFVGVIAQLAVTDGLAEMLWVLVSIVGAGVILTGIVVLVRAYRAMLPPED